MAPKNLCLNCMAGTMINGCCTRCGKPPADSERPPFALPSGTLLVNQQANRRYCLGRVLGHGGFGITYLAWDEQESGRVAVKELFPFSSVTRSQSSLIVRVNAGRDAYCQHIKERFEAEARTIASLRAHPEIINVYDLFEALGTVYYVMEYLEGEDMCQFLRREGRLSWNRLEKPTWDALQSLRILHGHGLIHRDISPDNIFIQQKGEAKLIDFGSVRHCGNDHFTTIFKDSFAPTEMFLADGNQGAWTDTFSLCATLYYMLSGGKLPQKAPDRVASSKISGKDSLVPLSAYHPSAPDHVIRTIMQGLSLDIAHRFPNADACQRALFPRRTANNPQKTYRLVCIRGVFCGKIFPLPVGQVLLLGRGSQGNTIAYPNDPQIAKGISRRHCAFFADGRGNVYVQDQHSRFGTRLGGKQIKPLTWRPIGKGQTIRVGGEEYRVLE